MDSLPYFVSYREFVHLPNQRFTHFCSPMQLRSLTDLAALIVHRRCFFLSVHTPLSLSFSRDRRRIRDGRKHFFPPQFRTPPPEIMSFPFSRAPFFPGLRLSHQPCHACSLAISVPLAPFIRQTTTRKKGFALFFPPSVVGYVSYLQCPVLLSLSKSVVLTGMGFATAFDFEPCCRNRRRSC